MGLAPTSGMEMGTPCGDIDPGLVRYLMRARGLTIDQFHETVENPGESHRVSDHERIAPGSLPGAARRDGVDG